MKKTTLALGSTIACLFLLAACTDATAPSTSSTSTTKTTTQTSTPTEQVKNDQSASLTISGTEQTKPIVTSTQEDVTPVLPPAVEEKKPVVSESTDDKKNDKLINELVASGDYKRCSELTAENYVKDCELNILTNKAIQTKDASWCDKASEKYRENCKSSMKIATSEGSAPPGL
jgi:hypothetical protein